MESPSEMAVSFGRTFGDEFAFSDVRCVTFYGKAGRNFGDREISLLKHFPRLRLLHLENSLVSDVGLGELVSFRELEELMLTGKPLTLEAVGQLRPVIQHLKYMRIDPSCDSEVRHKIMTLLPADAEMLQN